MPDLTEVQASIAEIGKATQELYQTIDERVKALEGGKGIAEIESKLDKINASLDKAGDAQKRFEAEAEAQKKRADELEARLNRGEHLGSGVGGGRSEAEKAAAEHRRAFYSWMRTGQSDVDLNALAVRAEAVEGEDTKGGYVVPVEMDDTIVRVLSEVSPMRQICQVITIGSKEYRRILNVGGTGAGWVGEEEARAETATSDLRELVYTAHTIYANPKASEDILEDSAINLAQWIADEVQIKFAEMEGTAFISGSGVKQPRGLTDYTTQVAATTEPNVIQHTVATGTANTLDQPNDLITLVHLVKAGYRANGRFLMNRATLGAIRKMRLDQGSGAGTGDFVWRPGSGAVAGNPPTILGYPYTEAEDMAAIAGLAKPIYFGDFRQAYTIVDRRGTRVLRDPYSAKPYVSFYTTKRVGGGLSMAEAVKALVINNS